MNATKSPKYMHEYLQEAFSVQRSRCWRACPCNRTYPFASAAEARDTGASAETVSGIGCSEKAATKEFDTPMKAVRVDAVVVAPAGRQGALLLATFTNSEGLESTFSYQAVPGVPQSVRLPDDIHGVWNVVSVKVQLLGAPEGSLCSAFVTHQGELSDRLSQICHSGQDAEVSFGGPVHDAEVRVTLESRATIYPVAVFADFTLSNDLNHHFNKHIDRNEGIARTTYVFPDDGRGITDAKHIKVRQLNFDWANLVGCEIEFRDSGSMAKGSVEQKCHSGELNVFRFANPQSTARVSVTLEARVALDRAIIVGFNTSDGRRLEIAELASSSEMGKPKTFDITAPADVSGNITSADVRVLAVDPGNTLTCRVDAAGTTPETPTTTTTTTAVPTTTTTTTIPTTVPFDPIRYVALGDSYSAGEGNAPYENGKKNGSRKMCHRSQNDAYPKVAIPSFRDKPIYGGSEEGSTFDFFACSGGQTKHIIKDTINTSSGPVVPTVQHDVEGTTQLAHFEVQNANLITMSVGGNDIGFSPILKRCIFSRGCNSRISWSPKVEDYVGKSIELTRERLIETYKQAKEATSNEAAIVVFNYPLFFPDDKEARQCVKKHTRLRDADLDYLNEIINDANEMIQDATSQAGVHFVDVREKFRRHGICGEDGEWIRGLTFNFRAFTVASFHPHPDGQAKGYGAALNDFFDAYGDPRSATGLPANPPASSSGNRRSLPIEPLASEVLEDGPIPSHLGDLYVINTGRPENEECDTSASVGAKLQLSAEGYEPNTEVVLRGYVGTGNAEPVELGTTISDSEGNISAEVIVPDSAKGIEHFPIIATGADGDGDSDRQSISLSYLQNEGDPCYTAPDTPPVTEKDACDGLTATITGTEGNDNVVGTEGNDIIIAGEGNDVVDGKGGNDIICGGPGNDTLMGGFGVDTVDGGAGDDDIDGNADNDTIFGRLGKDHLVGGFGTDFLDGGDGNDLLDGNADNDTLLGGADDDSLSGGFGVDNLDGGTGNNTIDRGPDG